MCKDCYSTFSECYKNKCTCGCHLTIKPCCQQRTKEIFDEIENIEVADVIGLKHYVKDLIGFKKIKSKFLGEKK
ncbi:MAG: hypothetical protein AABY22_26140 [Nanoarchaeota archaeon]